jgi:signal transduction histidine kinase
MAIDLRPSILDDLGITQTLLWFCRQFKQTFKDINLQTEIRVRENDIDEKLKLVIYRIVQESFNNIVKHSKANRIMLKLYKKSRSLHLKIEDNGRGFSFEEQNDNANPGLGLNNMRERAELSGGAFHIDVNQPVGVRINVVWPIEN